VEGGRPAAADPVELILNRTWRPQLEITGAEGLPRHADAGNVLRPGSALKLSVRLPPSVHAAKAAAVVEECLTQDPRYGAQVTFRSLEAENGWSAPPLAPWLAHAVEKASLACFGKPPAMLGEGGSIRSWECWGDHSPKRNSW
jgi:hypothetical protein